MSKESDVEWLRNRVAQLEAENADLRRQLSLSSGSSAPTTFRRGPSFERLDSTDETRPSPIMVSARKPKYRPSTASTDGSNVDDTSEAPCNNCGSVVPLRNMQNHQLHCYRTVFKCPMCAEPIQVKTRDQHTKQERGTPAALGMACAQDKLGLVSRMVAHGASIEEPVNDDGDTPVHIASRNGNLLILQFLLSKGVNVNSVNGRGETALHVSVINKDLFEVSAYLLSQGADTTVTTPMGDNALELAQRHHNTEIALLISRHSRQSLRPGSSHGSLRPRSSQRRSRPSNRPQVPPPSGARRPSLRGRRTASSGAFHPHKALPPTSAPQGVRSISPIMSPRR